MAKIMGLAIEGRSRKAPEVQEILTKHGCIIKTRLGIHETDNDSCSQEGIILLMLSGEDEEIKILRQELENIDGVRVNIMTV